MGSAISSGTYAKPVKAMYSASIPIILETAVSDLLPTENRAFSMA
jgi:hypothetical protein